MPGRTVFTRKAAVVLGVGISALALSVAPALAAAPHSAGPGQLVRPVDPQRWVNPDAMTWDDFRAIPSTRWADPSLVPSVKTYRAAVVLVDYPNQPFLVTQLPGSSPFGLPTNSLDELPISREQVPAFYQRLLNTPDQQLNHGHTINEYWMEDTGGRYGVDMDTFGAYQLPGPDYEYHYKDMTECPAQLMRCDRNFRTDAMNAWLADQGPDVASRYDNIFFVGAGMDESSTWQEFGEMRFVDRDHVPDSLGPPPELKAKAKALGIDLPNWAPTRYVPWTSWKSAASMWPNASRNTSIEAESSGRAVYAHEFSHNLGIGDNYNNPYGDPLIRSYSGIWDMLSRGSFNGPRGPHNRWEVPSLDGSQMGAHHMLRNQLELGTADPGSVVNVSREQLQRDGLVLATVTAREVRGQGLTSGINVAMSGGDRSDCATDGYVGEQAYLCDRGGYDNYTLEVNDRMGSDSFTPDSGVLLAKTKNEDRAPFIWVVDANPQDIDLVDFTRPDGTKAKVSLGDYRQLCDALFHAGTHSGSQFEYHDVDNGLQFYVLNQHRDAAGVLSYDVAIRADHASDTTRRGVKFGDVKVHSPSAGPVSVAVPVRNTGAGPDVFRVRTKISGERWNSWQPYSVVAAQAGRTARVTAQAQPRAGASREATMTIQVRSESDPGRSAVVTVPLHR